MAVRLYCFDLSHPSHAAKVMLETKGIAYEEHVLPAGLHSALLRLRGFDKATVPALKLDDGRRIQGTTAISQLLDELVPDPPLHPTPEVTEAERWGERELQIAPRRMFRWAAVRDVGLRAWVNRQSGMPLPALSARAATPIAKHLASVANADDATVQAELKALPGRLDRVDALLADGVIGGETLNAADAQIGTSVRVFLTFPQLAHHVEGRPCGDHARRVQPVAAEPVPITLPEAWLPQF